MQYNYRAVNNNGEIITGSLSGENERVVVRGLRRQGLVPLEVKNADSSGFKKFSKKRATPSDYLLHLKQLCTLLQAGVTLEETIDSLKESTAHQDLSRQFSEVHSQLRQGSSFAEAVKKSDLKLPSYFYPLIESAEMTGNLAEAIQDGIEQWEFEIETAKELKNALIYPTILVVSGVIAVFLIFILVVPKFSDLLEKNNDLPLLADVILTTGVFVNTHLIQLGIVLALIVCLGLYAFTNPGIKSQLRDFTSRLPYFGQWMVEVNMGAWSAMLSTLLHNKVPLLNSLELSKTYVSLNSLKSSLNHVNKSVRGGESLAASLQEAGVLSPTGYNLIKVGERSGELDGMLNSMAKIYIQENRERIKRFLIFLEPIAILVIGATVGLIMGGVILAITSVNQISV